MSPEARAWTLLGIEPTQDTRAIRSAYARQLKTIDPETDPKAFVQLRGAFEAAMDSRGGAGSPLSPESADEIETTAPTAPAYPVAVPLEEDRKEEAAEHHAKAILALLYGHQGERPWLDDAVQKDLIAHWRVLTSDPKMEQIDHYTQVERWARAVIVETSPLSAPILMLAAERFSWIDADTKANADSYMAEIARRYRLLKLLHAASRPGSPQYPAWLELQKPVTARSSPGTVDPKAVFEILAAMWYALPQLELSFDRARIRYWEGRRHHSIENPPRQGGWKGCIAAAIFVPLMIALAVWLAKVMTHAIGAGAVR